MYSIAFGADEDQKVHLVVNRIDQIEESQRKWQFQISDFHMAKLI